MSEGVFLLPRVQDTTGGNSCKQYARTTAFGTAGVSATAKAGRVYKLRVTNKGATAYFVQIHDKASAPTAGNNPIWEGRVAANGDVELDFGLSGLYVANGIGLALSTTGGALTLAAVDDAFAYMLYTATL